jgi:membrane protease YdiL (CAAX protease family)
VTGRLKRRALAIVAVFAIGLIMTGLLRAAQFGTSPLAAVGRFATPVYIGLTILAAILLLRTGAPFRRFGFELPFRPALHIGLAIAAVIVIRLSSALLDPWLEGFFGGGRDLQRFAGVVGSPGALLSLLAFSWAVAAFGEEIAFRIVLMRGIAHSLGDGRGALAAALIVQAIVFGLVHLYQGPAGVIGSAINGLIYGSVVLIARGSIWPATLAHGLSNTLGILSLYAGDGP